MTHIINIIRYDIHYLFTEMFALKDTLVQYTIMEIQKYVMEI